MRLLNDSCALIVKRVIIEPPIRGRKIIIVAIKNLRTGCSTFLPLTVTSICIVERFLLDLAFLFLIVLVLLAVLVPTVFSLRLLDIIITY